MCSTPAPQDVALSSSDEWKPRFSFSVVQTFCVNQVASLIAERQVVHSTEFFCHRDPSSPIFELEVSFGKSKEGYLGVSLASLDKDVHVPWIKVTLSDDQCVLRSILHRTIGGDDVEEEEEEEEKDEYDLVTAGGSVSYDKLFELSKATTTDETTWRVTCLFTYNHGPDQDDPSSDPSSESKLKVHEDLLRYLNEAPNADVAFVVQGERIKAHKGLLTTRSDYFSNMFRSDAKENTTNEVEVPDVEPKVFKAMLEFLYSGLPPKNLRDISLDLLVIADKYCLTELKEISRKSVIDHINADNVVDVLLVADNLDEESVMSRAKAAFRGYSHSFDPSNDAMKKLQTNPRLLTELLLHYCRS